MGRKPGSKNKATQKMEAVPATNEVSKETTTTDDSVKNTRLGYVGEAELDPERAAIYEEYEKKVNVEAVTESAPEAAEDEKAPEKEPEEKEVAVAPADTEGDKYVPVAPEASEKKKEEIKTVPYDALHEEREKRKLAQARAKELEEKIKALEATKTVEKPVEQSEDLYLTEEEKRIMALERKLADIEAKNRERETHSQKEQERLMREDLDRKIAETDKVLSESGYPGFQFLKSRVGEELDKLIADDPDNVVLNTPEGWKKIYVEKVFPTVRGMFVQADRQATMDKKKASKEGIGLAGSSGTAPKKEESSEEKEWTYDDYLAERMKNSL